MPTSNQQQTSSRYLILKVNRFGKWTRPDGQVVPDQFLEKYPTYFSVKLGVYKVVQMGGN
jgi:hypothetical protein